MSHAWSSQSLQLVLDGKPIPAEQYCASAVGRDANAQLSCSRMTERVQRMGRKRAPAS
jgi:bifunctional lysine-specific demethylase and histidyl-hydroxylase MINA